MLFGPDQLGPQLQSAGGEIGGHDIAVQSTVPDISDIAREQCIGLTPVGAIIVEHRALREIAGADAAARSPGGVVTDAIRRIGDHQMRLGTGQHLRHIRGAGAIAATHPMRSQQPHIAEPGDRVLRRLRDAVGIRQTARSQPGQERFELVRTEADQTEVEAGKLQFAQLAAELLRIPARPRRQLVISDPIGALFFLAPATRNDHRDRCEAQLCRRPEARVAGDQPARLIGEHRHRPSPFPDCGGNLVEIGLVVRSRIVRVRDQPLEGPALDPVGRPYSCRLCICSLRLSW